MARTIVALYDDISSARQVYNELDAAGLGSNFWLNSGGGLPGSGSRLSAFASDFNRSGNRVNALQQMGLPEDDAHAYAEGVRRGGTLLIGSVDDDQTDRAIDIINRYNPVDIDERTTHYRSSGWSRYEPGEDYTTAQAEEERGRYGSMIGTREGIGLTTGQGAAAAGSTMRTDTSYTGSASADRDSVLRQSATPGAAVGTGSAMSGTDTSMRSTGTSNRVEQVSSGREEVIPVVEEHLDITKRQVQGGSVRVRTYVTETPVEEQVTLRQESVHIERRAVNREVGDIPAEALRDRTIEVRETSEEAVVNKSARVTEEVVISKDVTEHTETIRDTVSRTDVEVEDNRNHRLGGSTMSGTTTTGNADLTGRDDRSMTEKAGDALRDAKDNLTGKNAKRTYRRDTDPA